MFRDILIGTLLVLILSRVSLQQNSKCYVVNQMKYDSMQSSLLHPTWNNKCQNGSYVKAVYAGLPTEHFQQWKCCGDDSLESWSTEIRDLAYLAGGSNGTHDKWNVQCPTNSIMTGFRYIDGNQNGLRILSAVRCSLLKDKITNSSMCTELDFNKRDTTPGMQNSTWSSDLVNNTWQNECPDGYGLVGLYDTNRFRNIHKGKCCRIENFNFKPGWRRRRNFYDNGGLTESQKSNGTLLVNNFGAGNTVLKLKGGSTNSFVRLTTPVFQNEPFCLQMTAINAYGNKLAVSVLTENTKTKAYEKAFKSRVQTSIHVIPKKDVYSQLQLDFFLYPGRFVEIHLLQIVNKSLCSEVDECENRPLLNCIDNEVCLPVNSVKRCVCPSPFIKHNLTGECLCESKKFYNATAKQCQNITTGGGRNIKTTTLPLVTTPLQSTQPSVSHEKVTSNTQKKSNVPPWVYTLAGIVGALVVVAVLVGSYLSYQKIKTHRKRRRNSFMFNLQQHDHIYENRQAGQYSLETVTAERYTSLYRPYMSDLGAVEYLPTPSCTTGNDQSDCVPVSQLPATIMEEIEETEHMRVQMHPCELEESLRTMGIPIYSRIDRAISLNVGDSDDVFRKDSRDDVFHMSDIEYDEVRRPSCMTLFQPDYGDDDHNDGDDEDNNNSNNNNKNNNGNNNNNNDNNSNNSSEIEKFQIPADDEEKLISDLYELIPERVTISSKIIGQGAFGLVKLGEYKSTNCIRKVAVKLLKKRGSHDIDQEDRIMFYQEAAIMSQFDDPNVVSIFGVLVGAMPCMVLEYMARGNLWKYLTKVKRLRKKEGVHEISRKLHEMFLNMARDIASGMTYLADLKFVHRDLATRNVLLDDKMRCKIGDFGLSRHFLNDDTYYKSRGGQIPVKWTAPEALQFKRYSSQSDVWSFGIVLWEIWSIGKRPYEHLHNDKVIQEVCEDGYRLPQPDQVPIVIYRLMLDCWKANENDRPTFAQVKFCLDHKNDRILGALKKQQVERTRSITISQFSDELSEQETPPEFNEEQTESF